MLYRLPPFVEQLELAQGAMPVRLQLPEDTSLIAARAAGCDDLVACASSECCPIPFVQIVARQATSDR